MRPSSVLLAVVLFAVAGTAQAGAFSLPIDESVCGEIDVADDSMNDPNSAFGSAESTKQCEKLCKKSGKLCKSYVKKSASCGTGLVKENVQFELDNCEVVTDNNDDERECKTFWKGIGEDAKAEIKSIRDSNLDACESWIATCIDTCPLEIE